MKTIIPGFSRHGDRFRAYVALTEKDAIDVEREARRRDVTVATVLRERVLAGSPDA